MTGCSSSTALRYSTQNDVLPVHIGELKVLVLSIAPPNPAVLLIRYDFLTRATKRRSVIEIQKSDEGALEVAT